MKGELFFFPLCFPFNNNLTHTNTAQAAPWHSFSLLMWLHKQRAKRITDAHFSLYSCSSHLKCCCSSTLEGQTVEGDGNCESESLSRAQSEQMGLQQHHHLQLPPCSTGTRDFQAMPVVFQAAVSGVKRQKVVAPAYLTAAEIIEPMQQFIELDGFCPHLKCRLMAQETFLSPAEFWWSCVPDEFVIS